MQIPMDIDKSAPNPPSVLSDALGVNESPEEAINSLTARLTLLSIESHSEAETVDMEDDLEGVNEVEVRSDDDSDEDWMDVFYDLELDKQLRDIYQLSKLPCYLLTPLFKLIHHPYPPLEIASISSEDVDLIKMLNLIREGHLSRKTYSKLSTFWADRIYIKSLYKLFC